MLTPRISFDAPVANLSTDSFPEFVERPRACIQKSAEQILRRVVAPEALLKIVNIQTLFTVILSRAKDPRERKNVHLGLGSLYVCGDES